MNIFIKKSIILLLPIILILIAVNYFGDAAKLFDSEYEKKLVDIINSGKYVTNIGNYDERILQRELIANMEKSPDIVVIGSSRTMLINAEYFPGKNIFNNSVSGASIEDLIAIYQIYKEHNLIPEKIILGIDPWIFNDNNRQSRWQSIKSYYIGYHSNGPVSSTETFSLQKYKELISLSYFQASLNNLLKNDFGQSKPIPTLEKKNRSNTKLTDGSIVYNADYRNASQEKINSKISRYHSDDIYSIENFYTVSENIHNEFLNFIKNMEKDNIDIEFFLCPYPPQVYETILENYPNVIRTEKIIDDFAQKNQIKIYGTFNPFILGFDGTYFYDGMHLKEKGIKEILKN